MLKWIGKMLGGSDIELPYGVPAQWAGELQRILENVDGPGGRKGLGEEVLRYVLHGEPASILGEVNQRAVLGQRLQLSARNYGSDLSVVRRLYPRFEEVPVAVRLRWAKLLTACVESPSYAFRLPAPSGRHWPEAILMHAALVTPRQVVNPDEQLEKLTARCLEEMLVEDGLEPSALLSIAFGTSVDSVWGAAEHCLLVAELRGYSESVTRFIEVVRALARPAKVEQRLHVLKMLGRLAPEVLAQFSPEIADLAVSTSKQVRAPAAAALKRTGVAAVPPLKVLSTKGKPDQRMQALQLLRAIALETQDSELLAFVSETALADKAPTIQALPSEWSRSASTASTEPDCYDYELPPIDWSNALTPQFAKLLEELWKSANEGIARSNELARAHHEEMKAAGRNYALRQDDPFNDKELAALRDWIAKPEPAGRPSRRNHRQTNWQHVRPFLEYAARQPGVTPAALTKTLAFFDLLADNDRSLSWGALGPYEAMHATTGRPSLLELGLLIEAVRGGDGRTVLNTYCNSWSSFARDWPLDHVWPFFAHNLPLVIDALRTGSADYSFDRKLLFRGLATLPKPPAAIVDVLFELALGTSKNDRASAQEALANQPNKELRIIAALGSGKGEVRTIAAQWLAKLRHAPAIPELEKAVAKEKQDVAKGAMLDALELLGQPVAKYLDRDALAAEASRSLAKGLPKDIDWFPWAALPVVRWADTGAPLPTDVLRWLLVQAVKQKTPEPNAVLRKYCAMFDARDREQLGQFVLEAWIAEDTKPIPADEAMKRAQAGGASIFQSLKSYAQYHTGSPYIGLSVEEITARLLPSTIKTPAGSAIGSKGLLAVAAACAGERAADCVGRYLKEWYGTRAAHGKALIAMLAWIEHPNATQLMLSIGSRFRTKSFQEEATRQAEALAERKGWTLDELADRTIPSAGFDETGTLELSYGERAFTAKLLPDFKVELYNPDGKKVAALSEPRQDDDADRAKDAKKAFSTAKKSIKSIVEMQTSRLYEALCTERDWSFDDWNRYLNQHAIVRRLVQRLIWSLVEDGNVVARFRPLDDGTLTDNDDNPVAPNPNARVRIAHDTNLAPADVARWQQHLLDYEVTPLFQQFGKGVYTLPEDRRSKTIVDDFQGHLIEAYSLRGRALKLGYTRGPAEDGGWFHVYEKRFPTLGLTSVIEFTGNPLPEENRTVALLTLSFAGADQSNSWQRTGVSLANVPKVLLSECYNDLRLIAADGSGYDEEWQKKSEYR